MAPCKPLPPRAKPLSPGARLGAAAWAPAGTPLSPARGVGDTGGGTRTNEAAWLSPPTPADQPRMDDRSCPPEQSWTEGQDETLRCSARGNPPPSLECAKDGDGEPFPAGVPRPVTRAHAGTYLCRATNPLGTDVRSITVLVQCEWAGGPGGLKGAGGLWGSWRSMVAPGALEVSEVSRVQGVLEISGCPEDLEVLGVPVVSRVLGVTGGPEGLGDLCGLKGPGSLGVLGPLGTPVVSRVLCILVVLRVSGAPRGPGGPGGLWGSLGTPEVSRVLGVLEAPLLPWVSGWSWSSRGGSSWSRGSR